MMEGRKMKEGRMMTDGRTDERREDEGRWRKERRKRGPCIEQNLEEGRKGGGWRERC